MQAWPQVGIKTLRVKMMMLQQPLHPVSELDEGEPD